MECGGWAKRINLSRCRMHNGPTKLHDNYAWDSLLCIISTGRRFGSAASAQIRARAFSREKRLALNARRAFHLRSATFLLYKRWRFRTFFSFLCNGKRTRWGCTECWKIVVGNIRIAIVSLITRRVYDRHLEIFRWYCKPQFVRRRTDIWSTRSEP